MPISSAANLLPQRSPRQLITALSTPLLLALVAIVSSPASLAADIPTAIVAQRQVAAGFVSDGLVEAARSSTIAAQVPGRVMAVAVKAGDSVRSGQILAKLDERESDAGVAASAAQIAAAQATLTQAQTQLARTQSLVKEGFLSRAALDANQAQADSAAAQLKALQASAVQAKTLRQHATLRAPYDALISSVSVSVGDLALPGTPLMQVFSADSLRVTTHLPQTTVTQLGGSAKGLRAQIELGDGRWISPAKITLLPSADPKTNTAEIRLELPAASGAIPGEFLRVRFVTGQSQRLVVPQAAILQRAELQAVMVQSAEGFRLRQVRLGEDFGADGIEVLAGLKAGERVSLAPVQSGLAR